MNSFACRRRKRHENQPRIKSELRDIDYIVGKVVDHNTGRGRKSLHNYKFRHAEPNMVSISHLLINNRLARNQSNN